MSGRHEEIDLIAAINTMASAALEMRGHQTAAALSLLLMTVACFARVNGILADSVSAKLSVAMAEVATWPVEEKGAATRRVQ